jgi:hypothetical protein
VRSQGELEVSADKAIVALLGIDDEVTLAVIQFGDDRNAGHARNVVAQSILAGRVGIFGARAPKRIGGDFRNITILRQQMDNRDVRAARPVEQTPVGGDHLPCDLRRGRHGRDVHIEMAAVQIDRDDCGLGIIDTEVHMTLPFDPWTPGGPVICVSSLVEAARSEWEPVCNILRR